MLRSATVPRPANDERCRECSLRDICQPEAIAATIRLRDEKQHLFERSSLSAHFAEHPRYVITPNAYAHLENNTVRIDVEREKKIQVPLHHLGGQAFLQTSVTISPALMTARRRGKDSYCGRHGFQGPLEGPVSGNILLRQAQHRKSFDAGTALEICAIVAGN